MIIDIAGVRGAISEAVYMGSPVYLQNKVNKQVHKKICNFYRVGTIAHR